jgi:hypothetical protein
LLNAAGSIYHAAMTSPGDPLPPSTLSANGAPFAFAVRLAGLLLALGGSGCCDDFSKVEQSARGDDKASRVVWTARIGDAMHAGAIRVGATAKDETVVAASLQGDVTVGGEKLPASRGPNDDAKMSASDDVAVWKLRANGKPLWALRFGDAQSQQVTALSVTGAGTIFVGGRFEGSMPWGNHAWTAGEHAYGGFVGSIDPSGVPGWGTWFDAAPIVPKHAPAETPPTFGATVSSVGTDAMGRLFVLGNYQGKFRVNGKQPIVDAPDKVGGSFFARFDLGGAMRWFRLASYPERSGDAKKGGTLALHAVAESMCSTRHGNVVLVGTASGEGTFVGLPMKAHPTGSLFVSVWNQSGEHLWDYLFPASGEIASLRVAVEDDGGIYIAGITRGKVTLDATSVECEAGGSAVPPSVGALFVARLEPSGKALWLKRLAHARWDSPLGLSVAGNDGFVVTATVVEGQTDVGGGALFDKPMAGKDGAVFVARYGVDGKHQWSRGFITAERNSSGDVVVGKSGRAVVTGLLNVGSCPGACEQKLLGDVFVAALGK